MRRLVVLSFTAAALVLAAPAGAAPRAYTYEPIAYLGGPAPGGGTFAGYVWPNAINANGEVAFEAGVSDGSDGVFTGTPGDSTSSHGRGFPLPAGRSLASPGARSASTTPGSRPSPSPTRPRTPDPSTGRTPGAGRRG